MKRLINWDRVWRDLGTLSQGLKTLEPVIADKNLRPVIEELVERHAKAVRVDVNAGAIQNIEFKEV